MSRSPSRRDNDLKGIHSLMIKKACLYRLSRFSLMLRFLLHKFCFFKCLSKGRLLWFKNQSWCFKLINLRNLPIQTRTEYLQVPIVLNTDFFTHWKIKAENIVSLLHNKNERAMYYKLTTNILISCWLNIGVLYWYQLP